MESGAFRGPYTFKSRLEDGEAATNPEELLGAANAGCFTMALTPELSRARFTPKRIHTGATVTLSKVGDGFAITRIHLETTYRWKVASSMPGISHSVSGNLQGFHHPSPSAGKVR